MTGGAQPNGPCGNGPTWLFRARRTGFTVRTTLWGGDDPPDWHGQGVRGGAIVNPALRQRPAPAAGAPRGPRGRVRTGFSPAEGEVPCDETSPLPWRSRARAAARGGLRG